jgi:hypothetical protein
VGKKSSRDQREVIEKRQIELKNVAPVYIYTYIMTVRTQLLSSLGTFDSFLAGLGRNEVDSDLPKQHNNQLKPVEQR